MNKITELKNLLALLEKTWDYNEGDPSKWDGNEIKVGDKVRNFTFKPGPPYAKKGDEITVNFTVLEILSNQPTFKVKITISYQQLAYQGEGFTVGSICIWRPAATAQGSELELYKGVNESKNRYLGQDVILQGMSPSFLNGRTARVFTYAHINDSYSILVKDENGKTIELDIGKDQIKEIKKIKGH